MRMRAKITCVYDRNSISRAVASALSPDNLRAPAGMRISTRKIGNRVVTTLEIDGRIETILATLNDLLFCTSAAEKIL